MATGRASRSTAWRAWIALAVAYALVAQLVLAGAVAALAAAPGGDGDFRALICRPSAGSGGHGAPVGDGLPACCLFGCGVLNSLASAPPPAAFSPPPRVHAMLSPRAGGWQAQPGGWRRSAHLARAPPQPALHVI